MLSQNAMLAGSPPCSPQTPSLIDGRFARPRSAAIFTSSPTPSASSVTKGAAGGGGFFPECAAASRSRGRGGGGGEQALGGVGAEERSGVVARDAERGL